jgi:hypothetical protein
MMTASDVERAERLGRQRARMMPFLGVMFVLQQGSYFAARIQEGTRAVDHVRIGAWLILSIVLLLGIATGGGWIQSREVRQLLNDEVTRANRAAAMQLGFLAAMVTAIAVYLIVQFEPVSAAETVHLVVTIGIAAALLRFGQLERRAHR